MELNIMFISCSVGSSLYVLHWLMGWVSGTIPISLIFVFTYYLYIDASLEYICIKLSVHTATIKCALYENPYDRCKEVVYYSDIMISLMCMYSILCYSLTYSNYYIIAIFHFQSY